MAVTLQCPDNATLLRLFGQGGSREEMDSLAQHVGCHENARSNLLRASPMRAPTSPPFVRRAVASRCLSASQCYS